MQDEYLLMRKPSKRQYPQDTVGVTYLMPSIMWSVFERIIGNFKSVMLIQNQVNQKTVLVESGHSADSSAIVKPQFN